MGTNKDAMIAALKKEQITITLDGIETIALMTALSTLIDVVDLPEDAKEALQSIYRKLGPAIMEPFANLGKPN